MLIKILKTLWGLFEEAGIIFLLFFIAIIFVKYVNGVGPLLMASLINGESAVALWIKKDFSYPWAFLICSFCGNLDLIFWFYLLSKPRKYFEEKNKKAGKFFARAFDFRKTLPPRLIESFQRHCYVYLFFMGFVPCLILFGVSTSLGYRVRYAYYVMALGNTLKIILFGYLISESYGSWFYDNL